MNPEAIDAETEKFKADRRVYVGQIDSFYKMDEFKLRHSKIESFLNDQTPITDEWLESIGGIPDSNIKLWDFSNVVQMIYVSAYWEATIIDNDNFVATLTTRHDVASLLLALKLQ